MCEACNGKLIEVQLPDAQGLYKKCTNCCTVYRSTSNGLQFHGECGFDCVCEYSCLFKSVQSEY